MVSLFPIFVLGAALWALAQPTAFDWFDKTAITPALAVTMLGMGLTLTFDDFREVLATPGRIFAGFALQYTIMPLMAFAVSRLMGLPLAFTIGLCIVGSCPGGTASNVVTYLARADVTLSVAMTTASTLGAVVATPMLTQLLLGTLVPVDAKALLVSTLQVVLLPVLVGAAINTFFHKQVEVLAPFSALSAVVLIALICGSVVAQNAAAVVQAGPKLLAAIFLLHAGGFFLGYALSRAVGIPERAARTNSIEVGMQNSALGAVLASVHFPAHPLAAVPCAISACMHSVMGSLLAAVWRGRPTGELGTQDGEVGEPPAELAGAAAAVESAVEAAVGSAASTVAGTVAAAGANVLTAATRGMGAGKRGGAGPGSSGSASFGRSSHGGSGSASFGRSRLPAASKQASAAGGSGSGTGGSPAVSNQGSQGAGLASSDSSADGDGGTGAPTEQQRLSQQQMQRLLGGDF
ncbi:hypothetical protein COHA_008588 [Chlorella ohadii]|uniref:Uncharacterized protein n=1 Tax=Chlorella ohadii TaxID=2649997 RepID=A0AAD5H2C5_9CHLO|nr:hypothetical protein COHA_008588 [Chlorella ohadii]